MERPDDPERNAPPSEKAMEERFARMTPEERLTMVWTLSVQAWQMKTGTTELPVFRRDVIRFRTLETKNDD